MMYIVYNTCLFIYSQLLCGKCYIIVQCLPQLFNQYVYMHVRLLIAVMVNILY